jgi:hypothetical protein
MPSRSQTKVLVGFLLAGLLVLLLIFAYTLTRTHRDIPRDAADQSAARPEGFSFYDVHRQTVLDRRLRQRLADQLGPDAIAKRGPIDLTVIDLAFTRAHLPAIHQYHQALNPSFGGRREHAITTLTYRRAQQQGVPFRLIRMVFDQETGAPLFIVVDPAENDPDLFDTLQSKYGPPVAVGGRQTGNQALIWRRPEETLAGVTIRRRGGRITTQLHFFFTANIADLVAREQAAMEAQRRRADKAKQQAF